MYVIMKGDLSDGYTLVGPFETRDEAEEFDDNKFGISHWIVEMVSPTDKKEIARLAKNWS